MMSGNSKARTHLLTLEKSRSSWLRNHKVKWTILCRNDYHGHQWMEFLQTTYTPQHCLCRIIQQAWNTYSSYIISIIQYYDYTTRNYKAI